MMKSWFQDNDIATYSTHGKGKSAAAERIIRTLKNKIYKYMTSTPKNVFIDKLAAMVNKYTKAYQSTIQREPINVNSSTYIYFNKKKIIRKLLSLMLVIM